MKHYSFSIHTIIGDLIIIISEIGLYELRFGKTSKTLPESQTSRTFQISNNSSIAIPQKTKNLIHDITNQLEKYFLGTSRKFTVPIDWTEKTDFQKKVLQATQKIPYGLTASYKDIAIQINNPKSARAVGRAEATNTIPIIIPCHRVIGSDGKLHGYSAPGGLKLKAFLLFLEKNNLQRTSS